MVSLNSIGRWYDTDLGGQFAGWVGGLHAVIMIAMGTGLYYLYTHRTRFGGLIFLCALTLLLGSSAWLTSPENVLDRAIWKRIDTEYELEHSRSPDWKYASSPAERKKIKLWLEEKVRILRVEEITAKLYYERAKRQNDPYSLLSVWTVLCAGCTLLYWWNPTARNRANR